MYTLRCPPDSCFPVVGSWDYGAVHFTNIDTSTDFPNAPEGEKGDSGIFDAGHFAADGEYLEWVENVSERICIYIGAADLPLLAGPASSSRQSQCEVDPRRCLLPPSYQLVL